MKRALLYLFILVAATALAACGSPAATEPPGDAFESPLAAEPATGMGHGPRMGQGSMAARHHVTVPAPYAGLANPVTSDPASWERAAEHYSLLCASCHGDGGAGDGPAGANLDPAPAPVAHTSQMLGDDLLFWRISEGGVEQPFGSAMPAWKDSLVEAARWDLVNYMRALGSGQVEPRQSAGGEAWDPEFERAERAGMLAKGVEQGVITQAEADLFDEVHNAMDDLLAAGGRPRMGGMDQMRGTLLADLAAAGTITQEQADAFNDIHDRLEAAGLMQ